MAAFPPPTMDLHIPEPLRRFLRSCEEHCVAGCCGLDAFGASAEYLRRGVNDLSRTELYEALSQFEKLLGSIRRHPGAISADEINGLFNHIWPTPFDCLTYFSDWRREIAIVVSEVPSFFDSHWLTGDVTSLGAAITAERAFDRLPILADALEEAGCDNPLILSHLRENADHAHHCWGVDLLAFSDARVS